jgi:hypothetical protein
MKGDAVAACSLEGEACRWFQVDPWYTLIMGDDT